MGEGRTKHWGTETLGDLWKREGWGCGTRGIQNGHYRDFQEGNQNLKEVGWGWIKGGRKDRVFGWEKIRGGGEQLF